MSSMSMSSKDSKRPNKPFSPTTSYILGAITVFAIFLLYLIANFKSSGISADIESVKTIRKKIDQKTSNSNTQVNDIRRESEEHLKSHHDFNSIDGLDDTVTSVVECNTTSGKFTVDVRSAWAPLGSKQFITLVDNQFMKDMPFFRVCPKFLIQFGGKYKQPRYKNIKTIPDDKSLRGIRDINFGYVFFAGNGPNSRDTELVIALCNSIETCKQSGLGSQPWETPIGTIRKDGFEVLKKIGMSGYPYPKLEMIGQHPNAGGPDRYKLETEANYLKDKYPDMEYFKTCQVVKRDVHESRPLSIDHPDVDQLKDLDRINTNSQQVAAAAEARGASNESSLLVKFTLATTEGEGIVVIQAFRDWAPLGFDRFKLLLENKFFDGSKFFRVIKKFMAQFGMNADALVNHHWNKVEIQDDPPNHSNSRGTISFATGGPNTRSCQLFINTVDNTYLDKDFIPIGKVIAGMKYIDALYAGYGEGGRGDGTDGKGPSQGRISQEGNAYLDKYFPKLSTILKAEIIPNPQPIHVSENK